MSVQNVINNSFINYLAKYIIFLTLASSSVSPEAQMVPLSPLYWTTGTPSTDPSSSSLSSNDTTVFDSEMIRCSS